MNWNKKDNLYSIFLGSLTVIIWTMLFTAQFLEYDDNYANILSAFSLSVVATIFLLVVWFKARDVLKRNKWQTIFFLLMSSPITIAFVSINYPLIFGAMLKN